MNKERLEEIDTLVEDLYNDKIEIREFVQNSLEQAERVQQLDKAFQIENELHIKAKNNENRLRENNENIKNIITKSRNDILYTQKEALQDIEKLLEGDPHEDS